MFKILFSFVIIGFINAHYIRFKREQTEQDISSIQRDLHAYETYSNDGTESSRMPAIKPIGDYLTGDWKNDDGNTLEYGSAISSEGNNRRGPIYSAIKTKRYHRTIPIHTEDEDPTPHIVEIEPYRQPFHFIFKTSSNPLSVEQVHESAPGQTEHKQSEDEPHRVRHKVFRPVIQEIKEVIQPYRRIRQEIRPVIAEYHTIVAERERKNEEGNTRMAVENEDTIIDNSKQQSAMKSRTPVIPNNDIISPNDYSNRKGRYLSPNEVPDQKLKEPIKYRPLTPEVVSILDQMNNIMVGNQYEMKSLQSPTTAITATTATATAIDSETPLLNLNSGKIKFTKRSDRYSNTEDLRFSDRFDSY